MKSDQWGLRVAVVGVGGIARNVYFPAFRSLEVTVYAAVDPLESAREWARRHGAVEHAFARVEDLAELKVDCAVLLTPVNERIDGHFRPLCQLLRMGVPTFCEKPLSVSGRRITEIVRLAAETKTPLMPAFNRRFTPVYQRLKEHIAEHPPSLAIVQKSGDGAIYRELITGSVHMLDVMRWLFGEAKCVWATSTAQRIEWETTAAALFVFPNGLKGVYLMSRNAGRWLEEVTVHGDRHTAELVAPNLLKVSCGGNTSTWKPDGNRWMMSFHDKFGFTEQLSGFLGAVRDKRPFPITLEDGLASHRLVDEVLKCAGLPSLDDAPVPRDGWDAAAA